jgi:hypothetical protein
VNPPPPPAGKKNRRSAVEMRKYQAELGDVLAHDCARTFKSALGMFDGWNKDIPASTAGYLGRIREAYSTELKRLSGQGTGESG